VQLQELLTGVEVLAWRGDPRVEITDLAHDSRRVGPGACFACIVGARDDGHAHAPSAVAAGAVALLVERPLDLGVSEAEVRDVRAALGPAASRLHGNPSRALRCLGVTGTNGKTTTTYLIEGIARAGGDPVGVIGTTGARIDGAPLDVEHTTPEATELQGLLAAMRDAGVVTVAMEVSSHALAQQRVDGTWFTCAGFTNLSHDHLDFHGSMLEYFETKASLFDPERVGAAATNLDNEFGAEIAKRTRAAGLPTITYGFSDTADVCADALSSDARGSRFTLHDRRTGDQAEIHLSLLGRANVENALAAAAVAVGGRYVFADVVRGLNTAVVVPGRVERVDVGQPFSVLVDYAHTPDALAAALATARDLAGSHRVIVVFGCGGDRDRAKRPLMGRVAAEGADLAVLTSDNPRDEAPEVIAAAVLEGLASGPARTEVELDRRAALRRALDEADAGDVVLIAGKGHETGQTTGGVTVPFDDREIAREELGARAWS
jgi:UDP-N-acetylmuramoyl-L-alanyl-D-glutamate--2,6-diaminopimelate ligase